MKAEAKVDEAKEAGLDEQGDANMESAEKDDDEYASKLTEMVNGAMEEGDELLPDTLEKLRNFSLYGEEQGRRIPWFISHLATSASILSLGDNPPPASSTDDGRGTGSGRRASSRNPPTPPAPSRESSTTQDRDLSGASKGNKGKSDSQNKGKGATNKGKGSRYDRDDRGWTYSSSSGWRWEDYEYRRGNRGYWR